MTTPRGSKQLAAAIVGFKTACAGITPPPIIEAIIYAADRARKETSPAASFNRYVGAARRKASKDEWTQARQWLSCPEVVAHFSDRGAFWMLPIWEEGVNCLQGGLEVNFAFRMDEPGRPKGRGFSAYQDAAMYGQILEAQGMNKSAAREAALTFNGHLLGDALSERDVRRALQALPNLDGFDAETLAALRAGIEEKYSKNDERGD
ncbi:MAG: hypothetical protein ACPHE1_05730 [Pseudomonadales bacterium]